LYFNKIFTHGVFSLLQKILRWRHTGFNVHGKVRAQTKGEAGWVEDSLKNMALN
jgi:hypothetical protein